MIYVRLGSENMTIYRVSWDDYVLPKKVGGLRLTFLEDAMRALMLLSPNFFVKGGFKVWRHIA